MSEDTSIAADLARPSASELEALAVDLAVSAGALAVQRRTRGLQVDTKSSVTDVVTDVDRAVEEFLRAEILRFRPADSVLGEEGGDQRRAASPVRWLVDPIDGTVNFMLGLPQYAVSVAAEIDGQVVAGCVTNPVSGDVFRAARGHGAYRNDIRLHGPRMVPLEQAVIATGFGYDASHRSRQAGVVAKLVGRVGNLRRLGSAALDLCALATGWVDGYFEGPLGEWDLAAGVLIASEAGASLSGLNGLPPGPDMVAGAHPANAEEFFALLVELGADEVSRRFGES
jgi:myo-inositol-1(or 4)-monophosphatase